MKLAILFSLIFTISFVNARTSLQFIHDETKIIGSTSLKSDFWPQGDRKKRSPIQYIRPGFEPWYGGGFDPRYGGGFGPRYGGGFEPRYVPRYGGRYRRRFGGRRRILKALAFGTAVAGAAVLGGIIGQQIGQQFKGK